MLTTSCCEPHTFFNRLEDQFAVRGKYWTCKENVGIAIESRNSSLLMFLPTSQGLFVVFRWLKCLFPGVKVNRLNSLRGGNYCSNSYTIIIPHIYRWQPYVFGEAHRQKGTAETARTSMCPATTGDKLCSAPDGGASPR